jgi:hypothetical protein
LFLAEYSLPRIERRSDTVRIKDLTRLKFASPGTFGRVRPVTGERSWQPRRSFRASPLSPGPVYRPVNLTTERIFFGGLAILLCIVVVVGFARTYFLAGMVRAPLPSPILHIHGAAFTHWTANPARPIGAYLCASPGLAS